MNSTVRLPQRLLLGPGPANIDPRVMEAMQSPVIGHLDPAFMEVLAEIADLLRYAFGTANEMTMAVSGTGFSGMDAALANVVEPGDTVIVSVSGFFGGKAAEAVTRLGARPVVVDGGFGAPVTTDAIAQALAAEPKARAVFVVAAETSVGLRQPLAEIGDLVRSAGALYIVDTVTLLGGAVVDTDGNNIDVAYAGGQKCLGAIPGTAPITFGPRATEIISNRPTPVPVWYLDALAIHRYWTNTPLYHHTCSSTLMAGLLEALRIIKAETIEARATRHDRNGQALVAGLEAMGLQIASDPMNRLSMLTPVRIPEGISDADVRTELLQSYGIEIGSGLGDWAGKAWRIGLMGYGSSSENVLRVLTALEEALTARGHQCRPGAAVDAAQQISEI
ncbi:MAG: alanine--glyoxylate aminotransferase family protein [Chloroflexota bacterium]|jgi:alanine-glyoxylate transaminase/serine-glyoxylate transaminase/serine-pyruvate transaminase|nr:alanine--glyoxylate aminotransferase family protein [Chloroflexota bacterium]MDP6756713.1 alanine--glyoxylate aminotransferase family protein [Chloroflexota bacterium]